MSKSKMRQSTMFTKGEDLPLFTGTPAKDDSQPFEPQPVVKQGKLFGPPTLDELAQGLKMPDWLKHDDPNLPTDVDCY